MFKNYFKTALRNFLRQKTLSFINIIGLSIGIACFSLFLVYTLNEFSFDRFHRNADHIYRVYLRAQSDEGKGEGFGTYHPMPLGPAMKADMPEVEDFFRFREPWGESFARLGNNDMRRVLLSFADPSFFRVMTFPFRYGDPHTALNNPGSVVVTAGKARELFGTDQALGRTLSIKQDGAFREFIVTGVTDDIPANSSIAFDLVGSFHFLETGDYGRQNGDNWRRSSLLTFVKLRPGSGLPQDEKRFLALRAKYYPNEAEDLKKWGVKFDTGRPFATYGLQPLAAIHTDSRMGGVTVDSIDPKNVWIVLAIASIVLLIACINFTTLSIGRLAGRAREVGVRKVVGGERRQLIIQFLCEAILMALLSMVLGLLIARGLLPYFNQLSGRELAFSFPQLWRLLGLLGLVTLGVGLLAGIYPALVLSGFRPVEVLKTKFRVNGSNFFTRSLVTVQFALSVSLIIGTLVILRQVRYMGTRHPGFDKENVLLVDAAEVDTKKIYPLFRQALASDPAITGVTSAELGLGEGQGWSQSGFEYGGKHHQVYEFFVDNDYIRVLGMQMLAGRNFNISIASDSVRSVIINETMMREFGWNLQNAIGKTLTGYYMDSADLPKTPVVVGVVRDFNFRPLREKVEAQMFHCFSGYEPYKFFVRTQTGSLGPALAAVRTAWSRLVPEYPLKYSFLDESLDKFYQAERRWEAIAGWAGGISIFLACLGLFGLASLATVNRTKEIGIRKVLGASLVSIVGLLARDFVKLVAVALLLAIPTAWYFMSRWLEDYAYRIHIGWFVFAIAGLFAILIAFLTVSFHGLRAATTQPSKSLRTE